jgi:hypothetical protein
MALFAKTFYSLNEDCTIHAAVALEVFENCFTPVVSISISYEDVIISKDQYIQLFEALAKSNNLADEDFTLRLLDERREFRACGCLEADGTLYINTTDQQTEKFSSNYVSKQLIDKLLALHDLICHRLDLISNRIPEIKSLYEKIQQGSNYNLPKTAFDLEVLAYEMIQYPESANDFYHWLL